MTRFIKNTVASLLIFVFVLTAYIPTFAVGSARSYSTSSNSGQRDVICTSLDGTGAEDYYKGSYSYDTLSTLSGTQLLTSLRKLMTDTHSYISSYDDCHYKADKVDCENNNGKVSLIYCSYNATQSQWGSWNREHVWPKSLGGFETTGAGGDLHHIRPSDQVVNSTRGNSKYGNVNGGKTVNAAIAQGYSGGYSGSGYFEPLDNVKGDVARICLYVYARWGSTYSQCSNITNVFQSIDVLLEWCELDPVDTWEMGRNEVVESIQGNRNVFIDYPELAWLLFNREIPADMTTPSGEAKENQGSGNQGGTETPECQHEETEIRGAIAADCQKDGYTGDVYCSDCGEKLTAGQKIPQSSAHSFGEWTLSEDGVTYVSVCTVCGERVVLTVDALIAGLDSDAEKILFLLAIGASNSALLDALSK